MAQRLTVIKVKGDTDALIDAFSGAEEVFARKAPELGMIFSCRAKTDEGVMIVNLWPDAESSEKAFQDPEIQEALSSMREATGGSETERKHYEVVDYRSLA
jgi:hypothetical protein